MGVPLNDRRAHWPPHWPPNPEQGQIVLVSQREPLCTVHPDCWEAGIEMRRDCYAQAK